ncbi:MAG: hypothetical protein EOL91_07970 [Actinobacteria bacterium]|nr:hypothetical protein [Actinomycetota bacterium]
MGTWEKVDNEIMTALKESELLENTDVFVRNECKDTSLFEFPTLEMLDAFALSNDYNVLYLHTKGVTQDKKCIDDWRASMIYWNITRWRECVKKLEEYDTVGINVVSTPKRHFQGNFWWATTGHIRRIGTVREVTFEKVEENMTERHKCEFWILGSLGNAYCPYHHKINPYMTENPKENYINKKF